MMDWYSHLPWVDGRFLGIEWHFWKVVGWLGNLTFFSRFLVQWYATERQRRVVVPAAFWWLSLLGSFLLLAYAVFDRRDSVFIFAYLFTWIPYLRNLIIHRRTLSGEQTCPHCSTTSPERARFCSACGSPLAQRPPEKPEPNAVPR